VWAFFSLLFYEWLGIMGCMTQRKQPLSHQDFAFIYSKVPRLTVEVIVVVDGGVVLVKRQEASWQGQWHIPGGTVLYKELLRRN
jgi:hypothetical protein